MWPHKYTIHKIKNNNLESLLIGIQNKKSNIVLPCQHGIWGPVHIRSQSICPMFQQKPGLNPECLAPTLKNPHRIQSIGWHNGDRSTCSLIHQWDCNQRGVSITLQ